MCNFNLMQLSILLVHRTSKENIKNPSNLIGLRFSSKEREKAKQFQVKGKTVVRKSEYSNFIRCVTVIQSKIEYIYMTKSNIYYVKNMKNGWDNMTNHFLGLMRYSQTYHRSLFELILQHLGNYSKIEID